MNISFFPFFSLESFEGSGRLEREAWHWNLGYIKAWIRRCDSRKWQMFHV